MVDLKAENAELKTYFQSRLAESKKIWSTRGPDARIAAHAAKASGPQTWRQMKGMQLMMHEIGHVGNRPFMVGFAVSAAAALWIQAKFTPEMKKDSLYWSTYHGGK